jgi:hypothetical protein
MATAFILLAVYLFIARFSNKTGYQEEEICEDGSENDLLMEDLLFLDLFLGDWFE